MGDDAAVGAEGDADARLDGAAERVAVRLDRRRQADDLVGRNFVPAATNRLWCADIKYVRTWQGWLYLAAVMDCYSRRIVGWSMRPDLEPGFDSSWARSGFLERGFGVTKRFGAGSGS